MGKLLTISIAAYNVEEYIRNTLDSLIVPEILDKLEVFIVDDGGNDDTLQIAREYEAKYPETFHAVHKENGGYGSTVNYSIAHATGKYFKLLDGDDWYLSKNLKKLINDLERTNADVIINNYEIRKEGMEKYETSLGCKFLPNVEIPLSSCNVESGFGMWALIFKTDILRKSGVCLPEHRLYTDQLYCTIPFKLVNSIVYFDYSIYCYRIGRDGQSVSRESRMKHVDDALMNCYELCEFYNEMKKSNNQNLEYFHKRIAKYVWLGFHTILLFPIENRIREKLKEFDSKIMIKCSDIAKEIGYMHGVWGVHIRLCRKTNYWAYWLIGLIPGGVKNWQ